MWTMTRANDGKGFEELVTTSCLQYENRGMALIRKTPNPWIVVFGPGGRVKDAKPNARERLVDYMGVSHGKAVHFEAKSTLERTRFPLANIEDHQYTFLKKSYEQGAVSFVLVSFEKLHEVYLIPFPELEPLWSAYKGDGRKSIPYADMRLNFDQVKSGRGIFLDFLPTAMKGDVVSEFTQEGHPFLHPRN